MVRLEELMDDMNIGLGNGADINNGDDIDAFLNRFESIRIEGKEDE